MGQGNLTPFKKNKIKKLLKKLLKTLDKQSRVWYNISTKKQGEYKTMAVKDFKVANGVKAIVVDTNGKVYQMNDLSKRVANSLVLGSDSYPNDKGEPILHIWID